MAVKRMPSLKSIYNAAKKGAAAAKGRISRYSRRRRSRRRFGGSRAGYTKYLPWVLLASGVGALVYFWPKIKTIPFIAKILGNYEG